jgi:phage shock protein PspC (stress-responsive transcriptional regulator)
MGSPRETRQPGDMTEYTGPAPEQSAAGSARGGATRKTTLTRPRGTRMLAGVASGLASYVGIDVIVVRIAFVVFTFLGGVAIPLYLAGWLLIPDEHSGRSIAGDVARDLRSGAGNL